MLHIDGITLHFGDRPLFDNISAMINPGERIGLVGPNGAGKSTLLKVIAGEQPVDEGKISMSNTATIGYLPQDGVDPDPGLTVFEEVEKAFEEILELRSKIDIIQKKLDTLDPESEHHKEALEEFGKIQHRLEHSGSYTLKTDIERILTGLGFRETDFNRSTTEFSGGWLMRIALAKLLLLNPTYLLLDEPTNHLDIESLQWIESFLKNYEGAVILVSHDRAFLDSVTNRTLSLRRGQLEDYAGNYSFYEKKYAEQKELLKKQYENQQKELKDTREFIDRFRYKATKAKQVQSRIKQLEKMELIELEDEQSEISFRFPSPQRSGQVVLTLLNLVKRYGDNTVFNGIDYEVERGDKIAVVGPNGAGKSTLIRILAGIEPITSGKREAGYNVTAGYFAQHQAEELNPANTALDEMKDAGTRESETRLRTILGCFLFTGDDVFKKVRVLSGGEKSRLALAKMLLNPGNFLIFDEPTNHLDMQSKGILKQALQQYEGTLMIVSHDRDFLDPIVNKTLEVQPGHIKTWLGNVSYYLDKKQEEDLSNLNRESGREKQRASDGNLSRKEQRRLEAEMRNALSKKVKPLRERLEKIEKGIESRENRKSEIESLMADTGFYDDPEKVKEVSLEYEQVKQELADHLNKWEDVAGRIEFIEEEWAAEHQGSG
ncbi:ribosomal protection-like ABC-F family protein [Rhodohalobacter mucosus]|uniref:ABC transporter ATP-binding protein n=1 Tax=Rhodohalobacter mucosus TaxID=2079485 RepID=A0A316TNT9_9BACT|nr:ABC-F family ATP-binding cassette domain-containing protein [Rhodohalobacter mucosus]PWN05321.1 ABC transporter ATP-binding protein [Rhodohalobacter mucosus]